MGSRAVALLSTFGLLLSPLSPVLATPVGNEPRALGQTFLSSESSVSAPSSPSLEHTEHPNDDDHDVIFTDAADVDATAAPSWFTSTLMARRLLALSPTAVISTIFPSPAAPNSRTPASLAGQSVSLREYISDCDEHIPSHSGGQDGNGDPTLLGLRVSTTFRNLAAGSNLSVSIDWWDHLKDTSPVFPGFPPSEAGLPRLTLFGHLEEFETPLPSDTETALTNCYTKAHPDARVWLPGRKGSPHASFWAKMVVTEGYWIGGFGGLQQIGWINATEWKGIRRWGSLAGVGDGRGWEDVRLPGEGN